MVLNNKAIIEALNNGSIKITEYIWDDKLIKNKYDPSELKGGHKIRLHVGYLLRTLSEKRWINPKVLYNKRDGIIDLRKLDEHKYILKPGESVILFTNEVIELGSEYFGLLLSRVSLEETGLIVSHSYIDPNWEGVLQLVVTNNSEKNQILQEHCEIANLVLLKMEQKADETTQKKNEHYGVTWEIIKDNPTYPKWENRKRSGWLKFKHTVRTYWVWFTGIGIIGGVAIAYQIITVILNIMKFLNV